jgi:biopolymer transport protein ExbB/TolQ
VAEANHDAGTIEAARHELEFIEEELRAAVGLGGRLRRSGSDAERVRVSVTTRIRKAIERLRERSRSLSTISAHPSGPEVGCI